MATPIPPGPASVRVRAPAKINLALRVGPPRSDGFHPLATVYHAIALYDEVVVTAGEPGSFSVITSGEGADQVPDGEDHLALRAARLLAERHAVDEPVGVSLQVRKAIPVAAGLAGGSADAAAALLGCSVVWDLDVSPDELRELGAELGSDVPFALLGGTAIGSGRGELVAPVLVRGTYHWVVAFARHGLSTPAVYRRFDDLAATTSGAFFEVPDDMLNALLAGDPVGLGASLVNDLQAAAVDLQPQLRRTIETGLDYGALGAVVSGSGPTVVFLVSSESAAVDLCAALDADGVCRAAHRAPGPVAGARVIG